MPAQLPEQQSEFWVQVSWKDLQPCRGAQEDGKGRKQRRHHTLMALQQQ